MLWLVILLLKRYKELSIDTNSYFNNTNFDTNVIYGQTQILPETTTTITTTTTANENTYFYQPQEIQGTTTNYETQILPSTDSYTYYDSTQYNYNQPQTQNEYTTSYQTSNNIDLNNYNFGTKNIETGSIYTAETIPITQNETTTTTTTNAYNEPTNYDTTQKYDITNTQIFQTSKVSSTITIRENAFYFSFKNQKNEKDKTRNTITLGTYDDKNKPKIKCNNKTEIKINKEPNISKLNINLLNNKIINKNDNNKICKKVRLIYKNNNKDAIYLFSCGFVRENKDKCKLKYKGKEIELKEYISCKNKEDKEIEIILEIFKNLTHINAMFFNCHSLFLYKIFQI